MAARLNLTKKQALQLKQRAAAGRLVKRAEVTTEDTKGAKGKTGKTRSATPAPVFGRAAPVVLEPGDCLLRMRLAIRLTNGNTGRGGAWYQTANFRQQCEEQLIAWGLRRTPFSGPVTVHLVRILGRRQREWDSSSWQRGNWKEIEDALVTIGWFHDDSRQWIADTTYAEVTNDRGTGPAIVIEVRAAK